MPARDPLTIRRARLLFIDVQQVENLGRRHWHERFQVIGDDPKCLDQVGENLRDALQICGIFRERERRGRHDIFVGGIERLLDGFQSAIERELLDQRIDSRRQRGERLGERRV